MIGDGHGIHAARTDGEEAGAVVTRVGLVEALSQSRRAASPRCASRPQAIEPGQRPGSGGLETASIAFGTTATGPFDRIRTHLAPGAGSSAGGRLVNGRPSALAG